MVSLLRGVNLGPHNRMKMDALRAVLEALGLRKVETYVQSGNAVFLAKVAANRALAAKIETAIEEDFGFQIPVILRTADELRRTVAANPFRCREDIEPAKLLVTFLESTPDKASGERLRELNTSPDEVHLVGRELFVYFPAGAGRSKFPWPKVDKMLQTHGTARNWNTVVKLLEMAERLDSGG
jgi:uncharacterized protein (DUF1697 family)